MSATKPFLVDDYRELAIHWTLELLFSCGFIADAKRGYRFSDLANYILEKGKDDYSDKQAEDLLYKAYQQRRGNKVKPVAKLDRGIKQLQQILQLNTTEAALLKFSVVMNANKCLREVCSGIDNFNPNKFSQTFSRLLKRPEKEVREAIAVNAKLYSFGLLDRPYSRSKSDVEDYFAIENHLVIEAVAEGAVSVENLLNKSVKRVTSVKLNWDDYEHIKDSVNLVRLFLAKQINAKAQGGNILLYGPPGTGKTELSRLLAHELQVALYAVRIDETDGAVLSGKERMSQYLFAQALLKQGEGLMVFDEFEDSIDSGTVLSTTKPNKGWINNILESGNVPCIWICNDIYNLHDAYLRRFDLVVEVPFPDQAVKKRLLTEGANFALDETITQELAGLENLSPAIIASSLKVINTIVDDLPEPSKSLQQVIHSALGVQKEKSATQAPKNQPFNTDFIQANQDLARIPVALKEQNLGARICLYGPPGTGKTAYAHWLAEQIGKPIVVRKASDLLGSYVGQTERNIAKAFKIAKDGNSVLLIDEVDSFIYDRTTAQRSWETSCVNEMLTQMEEFEGIFIATTNYPGKLDQASLRRFDLKVDFDFLSAEQVKLILADYCERLTIQNPDLNSVNLNDLAYLTPGDFAAVKRRSRFAPINDLESLIKELKIEMSFKEQAKKRIIGFY